MQRRAERWSTALTLYQAVLVAEELTYLEECRALLCGQARRTGSGLRRAHPRSRAEYKVCAQHCGCGIVFQCHRRMYLLAFVMVSGAELKRCKALSRCTENADYSPALIGETMWFGSLYTDTRVARGSFCKIRTRPGDRTT